MQEIPADRIEDIEARIKSGLRQHIVPESERRSVQLADRLAVIHDEMESGDILDLDNVENVSESFGQIDTRTLQRLRKITEVVEDDMRIDIGHSKLARAAMTGTTLTSIGAFLVAGQNLLISANALDEAHAQMGAIAKIKDRRFHDFYRAICVFIAEGFLLTTPFNFKFAWRGTRYLNNRVVYRLRGIAPNLHRLILSEIHYVLRGIVPNALRSPTEFARFLTSMAVQTIQLLDQFTKLDLSKLPQLVESVLKEYETFVENMYSVTTGSVDFDQIIPEVIDHLLGNINLSSIPAGQNLTLS